MILDHLSPYGSPCDIADSNLYETPAPDRHDSQTLASGVLAPSLEEPSLSVPYDSM